MTLWQGVWRGEGDAALRVSEPTVAEVRTAAPRLTAFYNEPHNKRLLANTVDLVPGEVEAFYRGVRGEGGRTLLLWRDDVLMGDADFRHVDLARGTAEFAILIGDRAAQAFDDVPSHLFAQSLSDAGGRGAVLLCKHLDRIAPFIKFLEMAHAMLQHIKPALEIQLADHL